MCRQADRIKTSSRKFKKFGRSVQVGCDAGTNNTKKAAAAGVWPSLEFGFSLLNSSLLQSSGKQRESGKCWRTKAQNSGN